MTQFSSEVKNKREPFSVLVVTDCEQMFYEMRRINHKSVVEGVIGSRRPHT